jgi:hypothetical protein
MWLYSAIGANSKYTSTLSNRAMQTNLKTRLLYPIINVPSSFRCSCNDTSSNNQLYTDYHALNCKDKGVHHFAIQRHNDIRDLLYSAIEKNLPRAVVQREQVHYLEANPAHHKKPDVTFSVGPDPQETSIDVAFINVGAASYLTKNITKLHQEREKQKKNDHRPHLQHSVDDPNVFIPFIVDTLGNIGPLAKQFLVSLGAKCNNPFLKSRITRAISITSARKLDQMFAYYDAHKIDLQDLRDLNNAGMPRGRPRPRASAE